jgi:hypothetical protein
MLPFLNISPVPERTRLVTGPDPNRADDAEQVGLNCENIICFYQLRHALRTMRYAIIYRRR